MEILSFIQAVLGESWEMLSEASIYILFGLLVGGLLKMFLSASYVAHHLGRGRFKSVLKAALFGIPIPLCSCGVLPAAASLKKQGANNGATTAFLISTPESGVDSISISYALLDPLLTVARPLAAFLTAFVAGVLENLVNPPKSKGPIKADLSCPVDNCCSGDDCSPEEHAKHHTFFEKIVGGLKYAKNELWGDLAGWFFVGLLVAGVITVLVPDDVISTYLGGGISSMLLMLLFGIPLYICATSSTPIAAALILKGVSPGAALVFLLVGPATNITSMSVLLGILGKRATALYLASIAVVSVLCGLLVDFTYNQLGISAQAVVGQASELLPFWVKIAGAVIVLLLSIKPLWASLKNLFSKKHGHDCGCNGSCSSTGLSSFPQIKK
ncbi:MAG: SO_0444 family Cu/Zn efflux transporter [Desulfobulbaceae bacterium]|nr:SO_0444 family Cu/Zn efflux transporter [Desulfobulbaceae bacterium]